MKRSVALTFAVRGLRVALGLLASIVTARALGPSGRGDYYFVVTFAGVLVQFGQLGLASSNTYLVARDRSLLTSLTANSLWVSVVVGGGTGVLATLILLTVNAFQSAPASLLWFGVAMAPPSLFYLLGVNLLVGDGRITAFNAIEMAANALVVLLIAIAASVGAGVAGFLTASVFGWLAAAVALLFTLLRRRPGSIRFDRGAFAAGFRYAAKAYLITLLGYLVLRSNVFLLQSFAGASQVGYYSVAAQIADVLTILPASVALVLFPDLVRDVATRWSAMRRATALVSTIIVGVCAVTALVADPSLILLYGPSFAPAVDVLLLMLPGVAFLSAATIISQYLGAVGLPRSLIAVWAIVLILVVVLNLVLTPRLGAAGAALALSAGQFVLLVLVSVLAVRHERSLA